MRGAIHYGIVLALVLSFSAIASERGEVIGRVVLSVGTTSLHDTNGNVFSAPIKAGERIYAGNVITTGKMAFVKVIMSDDSVFHLGPLTSFVFYKKKIKNRKRRSLYEILYGQIRGYFKKRDKGDVIKIKASAATMGIRGTEILVDVYRFEGKKETDIALLSGDMAITYNRKSKKHKTVMRPGELFRTVMDKKQTKPLIQVMPQSLLGKLADNKLFLRNTLQESSKYKVDKSDVVDNIAPTLIDKKPSPVGIPSDVHAPESVPQAPPPPGGIDPGQSGQSDPVNDPSGSPSLGTPTKIDDPASVQVSPQQESAPTSMTTVPAPVSLPSVPAPVIVPPSSVNQVVAPEAVTMNAEKKDKDSKDKKKDCNKKDKKKDKKDKKKKDKKKDKKKKKKDKKKKKKDH